MSAITTTRVEMKVSPRLLEVIGRELVVDDGLQRKVGRSISNCPALPEANLSNCAGNAECRVHGNTLRLERQRSPDEGVLRIP